MNRFTSFAAAVFISIVGLATPGWTAELKAAKELVENISQEVVSALTNTEGDSRARQAAFEQIFDNRADISAIGRFVVGRYWRSASKADQQAYLETYKDFIAFSYAEKISSYSGEVISVGRVIDAGSKGMIVKSHINRGAGAPPISIDWRLKDRNGDLKVIDMIVERVSLAVTQRSEFQSRLAHSGGDLSMLTRELRQRMGG